MEGGSARGAALPAAEAEQRECDKMAREAENRLYSMCTTLDMAHQHQVGQETKQLAEVEELRPDGVSQRTPPPWAPPLSGVFTLHQAEIYRIHQVQLELLELETQDFLQVGRAMETARQIAAEAHGEDAFNSRDPRMVLSVVSHVHDMVMNLARRRRDERFRAVSKLLREAERRRCDQHVQPGSYQYMEAVGADP